MGEITKLEDELVHEEKRFRQMDGRLNDLIRSKDSLVATLDKAAADLASIRKAVGDLKKDCIDKENRVSELRADLQRLDDEYADIDEENARLQDELNKLKDALADQGDKNASLYDTITSLEKELSTLNAEMNRLRSDLSYIEEKYSRANGLNAEYVSILEELKRAIEELTHQNKLVRAA